MSKCGRVGAGPAAAGGRGHASSCAPRAHSGDPARPRDGVRTPRKFSRQAKSAWGNEFGNYARCIMQPYAVIMRTAGPAPPASHRASSLGPAGPALATSTAPSSTRVRGAFFGQGHGPARGQRVGPSSALTRPILLRSPAAPAAPAPTQSAGRRRRTRTTSMPGPGPPLDAAVQQRPITLEAQVT